MAARCSARLAPPLVRVAGEGEDEDCVCCGDAVFVKRAGVGVCAMLYDGLDTRREAGEGAIGPRLPPL